MTEVAPELIETLESVCDRFCGQNTVAGEWNAALWNKLEELGVTLLPVAEEQGGAGADLPTTAAVLQVLGGRCAAVPAAETALLAGWLIAAGNAEVPAGPHTAALGTDELVLDTSGPDWRVRGALRRVPWARHCRLLTVLFPNDNRVALIDPQVTTVENGTNLAGEARDTVHLEDIRLPATRVLKVNSALSAHAFQARAALGKTLLMAGAAETVIQHCIRYARQREQFGRPIAKFQSIQQYIAQMAGEALALRVAADTAVLAVTDNVAPSTAVAAAKITAGQAASTIAALAHQIHGAIGFTEEHPLHLATTRLWSWREEDGNDHQWASHLGERALRTPAEHLWQRFSPATQNPGDSEG